MMEWSQETGTRKGGGGGHHTMMDMVFFIE